MQILDGRPVFSATDLVGFLACEHLTGLELAGAARLVTRPIRPDPELDLIQRRGLEHERRFLAELEAAGRRATRIEPDGAIEDRAARLRRAAAETEQAIRRGDDVIYQATFFDGRWLGFADFLLRVETPSALGPWSYEVADTKLARHTKASALLQICSYIDQLTRIQGLAPRWMHVALGGSARAVERFRVADYMAYYRQARRLFEEKVAATEPAYPPVATYPEPVDHCDVCRWSELCTARRRADDDLSRVAGITSRQRGALKMLFPVNLYGPRDNFDLETSHVIPALLRKCVTAKEAGQATLTLWGDGSPTREFLYVEDAAEGILLAAEHYEGSLPVNLGTGEEVTIRNLATMIATEAGFTGQVVWDTTKPNGQPRRCLDVSRTKELFGFQAKHTLREGLKKTMQWFFANRHNLRQVTF